jgi:hypothetical protein
MAVALVLGCAVGIRFVRIQIAGRADLRGLRHLTPPWLPLRTTPAPAGAGPPAGGRRGRAGVGVGGRRAARGESH